jgi:hypothetical protein
MLAIKDHFMFVLRPENAQPSTLLPLSCPPKSRRPTSSILFSTSMPSRSFRQALAPIEHDPPQYLRCKQPTQSQHELTYQAPLGAREASPPLPTSPEPRTTNASPSHAPSPHISLSSTPPLLLTASTVAVAMASSP